MMFTHRLRILLQELTQDELTQEKLSEFDNVVGVSLLCTTSQRFHASGYLSMILPDLLWPVHSAISV